MLTLLLSIALNGLPEEMTEVVRVANMRYVFAVTAIIDLLNIAIGRFLVP
jgi:hypothetical protein